MKKNIVFFLIFNALLISLNAQNNCLDFDGTDDYVDCGNNTSLNPGVGSFTIESWIRPDGLSGTKRFIWKNNGSTPPFDGYYFMTTDDRLMAGFGDGSNSIEVEISGLTTGSWYHVVMIRDVSADKVSLYLNGVKVNEKTDNTSNIGYSGDFAIGGRPGEPEWFDGQMDEIRIWNDARTKAEIRANMYKELAGTEDNLVAYYKLNETSGTNGDNAEGTSALDGTLTNMDDSDWVTSSAFAGPKNCLDFDGSNDHIDLGTHATFETNYLTVETWVKPGVTDGWQHIVSKRSDGEPANTYFQWSLQTDDNTDTYFFGVNVGGTVYWADSDVSISTDWTHLAGTYDGETVKIYVNGILKTSNTDPSGNIYSISSMNIYIAARTDSGLSGPCSTHYYNGKIDEVRIWNDVRTEQEIRENMCKTLVGNETGLIAYYNFDNSSATTLQDFSGNDNNGTLYMDPANDWISSTAFNTWLNTDDISWSETSNWSRGSIPVSTDNVGITSHDVGNDPTIGSALACNNLVVGYGAILTFNYNGSHTIHGNAFVIGRSDITNGDFLTITKNLDILFLSSLNIEPEGQLTIGNNLDIWATGTCTVKSDATSTGSLIVSGTSTGNVIFKRYVDDIPVPPKGDPKWHYVSSPVSGQSLDGWMSANNILFNDPAYQFYRWDEDTDYWIYYGYTGSEPENFGDATFVEARGYTITRATAGELSFTGSVVTDDVNYAATYTADKGEGWNLVGNPFTSALAVTSNIITADEFLTNAANLSLLDDNYTAVYIWDEESGYEYGDDDYKVIGNPVTGSYTQIDQDYVQPGQAFMVKVSSSGNLQFNEEMQAHASVDFYKQKQVWSSIELLVKGNGLSNNTAIGFHEGMTKSLDPSYDVGKLKGNPDIALYTRLIEDNGIDFAIQALPPLNTEKVEVKIGLDVSQTGDYNFKLMKSENFDEAISIKLEDKETGSLIDFREIEEYSFNISEPGQIRERFVLHFNNATGIEDQTQETENMRFYVYENKLYIIDKDLKNGTIQLFNMLGQPLMEKQYSEAVNILDLNLKTGYYVVRIITDKSFVCGKVFVE